MVSTFQYFKKHPIPPTDITVGASQFKEYRRVKIADLYPNQPEVDEKLIAIKRKRKQLTQPYVLKYKDKEILMDGHHTTISKLLNGQRYIFARYYNYG